MKTLVALVDFSDVTGKVIAEAEKLARGFDARVIIAHVLQKHPVVVDLGIASPTIMQEPSESAIRAEQAKLEELRDILAARGVKVEAEQWPESAWEKVRGHLERLAADMVVVGSHHHSSLFKLLVGGFGDDLLKNAPCPVLVVPADSPTESAAART